MELLSHQTQRPLSQDPSSSEPGTPPDEARLISVALRSFRMEAMVAFYHEAFGIAFEPMAVGGMEVQMGRLGAFTLKLVPLSGAQERDEAPSHQLGFWVPDPEAVLSLSEKYGGGALGPQQIRDGQRHLAVLDPDGNPVELTGPSEAV
jgi:predicted enzyme related to lactoylglutathione lyase